MTVRSVRLTDKQHEALEQLAERLKLRGQRQARFQPLIRWLADVAIIAPRELAAALEIAGSVAAGNDWYEMIDSIEPEQPAE